MQSTHRGGGGGDNEPRFFKVSKMKTRADRISLVIALSDEREKKKKGIKESRNEEVFWRWRDRGKKKGLLMLCRREVHRPTFQRK